MNVKWLKNTKLNQEDNILEMCLLQKIDNENYNAITVPCLCKDFFQDSFYMARMRGNLPKNIVDNKCFQTYGYKVDIDDPTLDELNKDILYLSVRFKNNKLFDSKQNFHAEVFMNYYDKLFNKPSTKVYISDDLKSLVFEYSKEWTNELYMVSLFTLLSRCSVYCDTEEVTDKYIAFYANEIIYKKNHDYKNQSMFITVENKIKYLLDDNYQPNDNNSYKKVGNKETLNSMQLHHFSGILSLQFTDDKTKTREATATTITV